MSIAELPRTITYASREAWLGGRPSTLGASECPVALGVSEYKSAHALALEKMGLLEPDDLTDVECVFWGNELERAVGTGYAKRSKREVEFPEPFTVTKHPDYPWLRATLDAVQLSEHRPDPGTLQIKTANQYRVKDFKDEFPLDYQVQTQAELAVSGLQWGTLAVLIGGQQLRWFDFERDDSFIEAMLPRLVHFWRCVETKNPPPVDGSESTSEALRRLYPNDDGNTIVLPLESAEWDAELVKVKQAIKDLESVKVETENKMRLAIGAASAGLLPDGTRYTWKTQSRAGYTVAPGSSRVLRKSK